MTTQHVNTGDVPMPWSSPSPDMNRSKVSSENSLAISKLAQENRQDSFSLLAYNVEVVAIWETENIFYS